MATDESQTRSYFVTFSATASTTGTTELELPEGYLTELQARVEGTVSTTAITAGPVKLDLWLRRGQSYRKLCEGAIQGEFVVKGSGQLKVKKGDAVVIKWTEISGTAVVVRVDAFMDEHAQGIGAPGWTDETQRTAYLYTARRVATQANVAAGAIVIDTTLASGQMGKLVTLYAINSGTNSLYTRILDEDNATHSGLAATGSAAGVGYSLPHVPSSAAVTTASAELAVSFDLVIPPGCKLTTGQGGAGAQNDTLTIGMTLLLTTPDTPTWDKSRSTNAADVTLAASTISAANTWQIVRYPL